MFIYTCIYTHTHTHTYTYTCTHTHTGSWLLSLFANFLRHVEVRIKNTHVRYEDEHGVLPANPFVFGVTITEITVVRSTETGGNAPAKVTVEMSESEVYWETLGTDSDSDKTSKKDSEKSKIMPSSDRCRVISVPSLTAAVTFAGVDGIVFEVSAACS
jgi:hypothetical protein